MFTTERDPCPGCGRLIAYAKRIDRAPDDTARLRHNCPHGRNCAAFISVGSHWTPGDARHERYCVYCAAAAREAAGVEQADSGPLP